MAVRGGVQLGDVRTSSMSVFFSRARSDLGGPSFAVRGGVQLGHVATSSMSASGPKLQKILRKAVPLAALSGYSITILSLPTPRLFPRYSIPPWLPLPLRPFPSRGSSLGEAITSLFSPYHIPGYSVTIPSLPSPRASDRGYSLPLPSLPCPGLCPASSLPPVSRAMPCLFPPAHLRGCSPSQRREQRRGGGAHGA